MQDDDGKVSGKKRKEKEKKRRERERNKLVVKVVN